MCYIHADFLCAYRYIFSPIYQYICINYYGLFLLFMMRAYLDLTAADPGVPGSSNWAVWGSAHGFTGRSVEQKKEQKKE